MAKGRSSKVENKRKSKSDLGNLNPKEQAEDIIDVALTGYMKNPNEKTRAALKKAVEAYPEYTPYVKDKLEKFKQESQADHYDNDLEAILGASDEASNQKQTAEEGSKTTATNADIEEPLTGNTKTESESVKPEDTYTDNLNKDIDPDAYEEFNSEDISNQQQNAGKEAQVDDPDTVTKNLGEAAGEQPNTTEQVNPEATKTTEDTSKESGSPDPTKESQSDEQAIDGAKENFFDKKQKRKLKLNDFNNDGSVFKNADGEPLSSEVVESLIKNANKNGVGEGDRITIENGETIVLTAKEAEAINKIHKSNSQYAPHILENYGFKINQSEEINDIYFKSRKRYEKSQDFKDPELEKGVEELSKETGVASENVKGVLHWLKEHWLGATSLGSLGIMGFATIKNYLEGTTKDKKEAYLNGLNKTLTGGGKGLFGSDPEEVITKAGENSTSKGTEEPLPEGTFGELPQSPETKENKDPATATAPADTPATAGETKVAEKGSNPTPEATAQAEQAFMSNNPPEAAYVYQNTPAPEEDMFMPDPKMLEYLRRVNPNTAYGIEQYYRNQRG